MKTTTPQPDSPEDILEEAFWGYVSESLNQEETEEVLAEALTKLSEYYTNKFLEIIGEDLTYGTEYGEVKAVDNERRRLRQAIKQLSNNSA